MSSHPRSAVLLVVGFAATACSNEPSSAPDSEATLSAPVDSITLNTPELSTAGATGVLVGAGDIAKCSSGSGDEATAKLLDNISGTVFTLGDNAYPDGTSSNYRYCYNPSWGRFRDRTRPSPGNHDYHVTGAAGYFNYFGTRAGPCCRGYYAYTSGTWRIYSLNSERNLDAQATWLKNDLANHPAKCVLAYWHRPLYTSGPHDPATRMRTLFAILYKTGAEIVLSGHNHNYERFYPQDADRNARSNGVRQFVVGTGGGGLYAFDTKAPNSQVRYSGGYGVLKLTLYDGSYAWKFVSVAGKPFTDSGSRSCH